MNEDVAKLSLEQQFSLKSFATQVQQMNRQQAQEMSIRLFEQLLVKDAVYRHLIKQNWGICDAPQQNNSH